MKICCSCIFGEAISATVEEKVRAGEDGEEQGQDDDRRRIRAFQQGVYRGNCNAHEGPVACFRCCTFAVQQRKDSTAASASAARNAGKPGRKVAEGGRQNYK